MKYLKIQITSLVIVGFVIATLLPLHTQAQGKQDPQGITISPAVVTISIGPNEATKTSTVEVTNTLSTSSSLTAELKGVDAQNGVLAPTKELDAGQKENISIDKSQFTLQPGEKTTITITVTNSVTLSPGGTYAALVIRQLGTPNNSVGFQSAVGAGIFITKQQGASRKISLTNFSIQQLLLGEPSKVTLTFKNDGNVHIVPRGVAVVTNQKGNVLYKKGVINQESFTILPQKSLTLDVPLATVAHSLLPSQQKVLVQYRFDGSDDIQTVAKSIIFVPAYLYAVILLLAISIVLLATKARKKTKFPKKQQSGKKPPESPEKKIVIRDGTDGEKIPVRRS